MRVALGIAALVGAIAVLGQADVPAVLAGLTAFRPGFHVVAGQMRATSTLIYPTIASMYLEVVFALGLWLLLEPVSRRPRLERSLVFAALVAIGAGISATFTRAGLIGMFVSMILVAGFRMLRMQSAQWNLRPMATLGVVLAAVVVVMHSVNLLAVRLGTEGVSGVVRRGVSGTRHAAAQDGRSAVDPDRHH